MDEQKTVFQINDYGHIHLKLSEMLEASGLSRNALARNAHTRFEVIDRWCENHVEKLDLDILARICYVLECRVDDLIEYVED